MTVREYTIRLLVGDNCNPCNDEASFFYVREILSEAFEEEAKREYQRCKLIMMEITAEKTK